jgi:putative addiction module component (TIGR02574 family)
MENPMSTTLQDIKEVAAVLSPKERAELASFLLRSLDEPDEHVDENAVRDEWLAVAERRAAEMASGKVVGIPADEVFKNLRSPQR